MNRRVRDRFLDAVGERAGRTDGPIRILEIGAGVGSMISRVAAWKAIPAPVRYRAVDVDPGAVAAARDQVPHLLAAADYEVDRRDGRIVATSPTDSDALGSDVDGRSRNRLEVSLEVADLYTIDDEADVVIAAALLDVVDLERILPKIRSLLAADGLVYAPCTYSGATTFAPAHPLDERIERLYHRHMDVVREQPGGSRAGRDLLAAAPAFDYEVLAAGGADWVVRPEMEPGAGGENEGRDGSEDGRYPAAEATFLRGLLSTIEGALADFPADVLDPAARDRWLETRRTQVDRGECVLIAHHLDVLARA